MLKPDSLRRALTAAIPDLAKDPDRMLVFIEGGTLNATPAPTLSFEYRYSLQLVLTDFAGHPDSVMIPLLLWISRNQPELLANPDRRDGIQFEAEVLANNVVDLSVTLQLTERVGVIAREGGGYDATHFEEPEMEAVLAVGHWKVYLKGELILEWNVDG